MPDTAMLCSMAGAQQSHKGLLPFTNAMALPGAFCVGCLSSVVLGSAALSECRPYRLCLFPEISITTWACTCAISLPLCVEPLHVKHLHDEVYRPLFLMKYCMHCKTMPVGGPDMIAGPCRPASVKPKSH